MKLLDLELRRAIDGLPKEAITELETELKTVAIRKYYASDVNTIDTDSLKSVIDVIREKYGLGPTTEIDDDKAIQSIADVKERMKQIRKRANGEPVRSVSMESIRAILKKQSIMLDVSRYAETLKSMSLEDVLNIRESLLTEMRNNNLAGRAIDEEYGLTYWDELYALNDAEARLSLRGAFSKCSEEDFKQKKSNIEGIERGSRYDWFEETREVCKILGIDSHDALMGMTMADVAEAIETRENELIKNKGINIKSIPIARVQETDLKNARINERNLRTPIVNSKGEEQDGK